MYKNWISSTEKGNSPISSSASSNSEARQFSIGVEVLIALGLCMTLLAVWFWYTFTKSQGPAPLKLRDVSALSLTTRADIVRAFHLMASDFGAVSESWWTHRRAASEVSRFKPDALPNLELLSELYEIARYSPVEQQLTAEQYQQARRALEQIATC